MKTISSKKHKMASAMTVSPGKAHYDQVNKKPKGALTKRVMGLNQRKNPTKFFEQV